MLTPISGFSNALTSIKGWIMDKEQLLITGGTPLRGEIELPGAKNAITKLLVASILSDHPSTFTRVPNIEDVEITTELCREIGSDIVWDRKKRTLHIETPYIKSTFIPQRFSGANRIPILMLGALLARTDEDIIVPTVGGCNLGKRPVNFHVEALESMGAKIEYREMKREGAYFARAHKGLHGAQISLPYPSVGATENALLASVRAKGTTRIEGAALEPEVVDLILYLQKMGAQIEIEEGRTIVCYGMHQSRPVEHHVIPDRNVAVSYACAALATGGEILIKGAQHKELITFCNHLNQIQAPWEAVSVKPSEPPAMRFGGKRSRLKGNLHIETKVHPGFMTDWQQPMGVLLTQVEGASTIHETVYENRFGYMDTLIEMGARIYLTNHCTGPHPCRFRHQHQPHSAIIQGKSPLQAKEITIPDLRGGFAYVIAALCAKGKSSLSNVHFLRRGYEEIVPQLQRLGAKVEHILPKSEQAPSAKEALLALR